MFSDLFARLARDQPPDPDRLARMFDTAMTKKLGVLSLPQSFWPGDPKINPRAEQLLWAALYLEDQERLALAFGAFVAEHQGGNPDDSARLREEFEYCVQTFMDLLPVSMAEKKERIRHLLTTVTIT